jgi:hypothetical protein
MKNLYNIHLVLKNKNNPIIEEINFFFVQQPIYGILFFTHVVFNFKIKCPTFGNDLIFFLQALLASCYI